MKLNKIFMLATLAIVGLLATACSDDDDYKVGEEPGAYNVAFAGEENLTLELTTTSFDVLLVRESAEGELQVPIEVVEADPAVFTVPKTATFADGEDETVITIEVNEAMKTFTTYNVRLSLPAAFTNPYADQDAYPQYNISVVKEDFKLVAKGIFAENILFEQQWEQNLLYSEMLGIYSMPDLITDGTAVYFYWNGEVDENQEFYMCDAKGKATNKFATGFVHPSYGMIMWNVLSAFQGYVPADEESGIYNCFWMPAQMTVSAGSFGADYELFMITDAYDGFPVALVK